MTLDYQVRAQDFVERRLSNEALVLDQGTKCELTSLLLEVGYELREDTFDVDPDSANPEFKRLRYKENVCVGFDWLVPKDLFANPSLDNYTEREKDHVYTLFSVNGEDAYTSFLDRATTFNGHLRSLKMAQYEYKKNDPSSLRDNLYDTLVALMLGGLAGVVTYTGTKSVETGAEVFFGTAIFAGVVKLLFSHQKTLNRGKAEENIRSHSAQFTSAWSGYIAEYYSKATFDQQALRKALGVE
ncbi:MAG: hypothetical protein WCV90_00680 [Candidatus Woesearchaeota archaeon]